ncbi:TolC family protein [Candidatus Kuenenia sp.]|uniref:TolC family protein n=1 Tax=Candidatus Kuenenia sp. TaxID=2499824 RepID=UPI00321FE43B
MRRRNIFDKIAAVVRGTEKRFTEKPCLFTALYRLLIVSALFFCNGRMVFGEAKNVDEKLPQAVLSSSVEMHSNLKFMNIGLKDSIVYALKNNFDIEISRLDTKARGHDIAIEKSVFDPTLEITGGIDNRKIPINSVLVSGETTTEITPFVSEGKTGNAVLRSLIPTGATLSLEYNLFREFVDPQAFTLLTPTYENYIEAKITQPLLKGAGWFYNRSPIYIARNNKKISIAQFKSTAIEVSNAVQEAYWNFVKAIEDLKVAKKSLERAEDLLRKNKIEVESGTLAPIEIIEAESGVASRVEAIISAENTIRDKEDELKRIMNLADSEIISDVEIVPVDKPTFEPKEVPLKETIKIAMEKRPELKELQIEVENAGMEVRRKKNELFPQLDLTGGVRYSGLGGTPDGAHDSTFSEDFQGEFITLTLEIPIGNRAARNDYKKAKLGKEQSALNVKKKELDIVVEVRGSVREVMTNIERVMATRKARELAQKRLEVEEKKYSVGRSTSLEILRAQEDLATAEGNETKALTDYEISRGSLEAAKGTILDAYNIQVEEDIT